MSGRGGGRRASGNNRGGRSRGGRGGGRGGRGGQSQGVCFEYQFGNCKFGEQCWFKHVIVCNNLLDVGTAHTLACITNKGEFVHLLLSPARIDRMGAPALLVAALVLHSVFVCNRTCKQQLHIITVFLCRLLSYV